MIRIYKAKDYNDLSRKAANIISAQIIMKPNCVLGNVGGSRTCLPHDDLRAKRDFRRHHRNMEHARPGRGNHRL